MKRICMVFALMGTFMAGASAQSTINLEAAIARPAEGQTISPGQVLDTAKVLCGVFYNGPDDILQDDRVWVLSSFSRTNGTDIFINGISFGQDLTAADSGFIYVIPNANKVGPGHHPTAPLAMSSDSIKLLMDWDLWTNNDSISFVQPPFVNGKSYGFFFRALYVGDASATPIATDPSPANNLAVQRIVWSSSVGINDLFTKQEAKALNVYPVPANTEINFEFNFDAPSHAQAFVRDMNGRVVKAKNFGRALSGVQKYSIDISALPNGIYTVELNTDTESGKAKFTIAR
jgi:hypothetical protein